MENSQPSGLFGRNIFTDAFKQFDEDSFFEGLHEKVRNKSYFQRYRGFRITLTVLSYLFNLASALTASYAAYWLTRELTGSPTLSWIISLLFLFFLEKIKRKSSTEFWQVLFFQRQVAYGWLALSLACLGVSLGSSAFGVKEGTEELGPGAELIAMDSTAQDYRNRIARLEADNLKLEQQRNRQGEIYWPAQQEKEQNKLMIAQLSTRILELDKKLEGHNDKLSQQYQQDIQITAWTLVYVTIAMEILFELCIAWIWYYFFRSYVERSKVQGIASAPAAPLPSHPSPAGIDPAMIQTMVKQSLEQMAPPPSPPASSNGQTIENRVPIGFYTDAQRTAQRHSFAHSPVASEKSSVQSCTDLYREETDRYTVIHEYQKGGQTYRTPYTRNQVIARINQYQRDIDQALRQGLDQDIVENRRRWLQYWKGKLKELDQKEKKKL
jgi:hypothetical protein